MNFNETSRRTFVRKTRPEKIDPAGEFVQWSPPVKDWNRKRLQLALPRGELERGVKQFFREIGLQFPDDDRAYKLPVDGWPIDFIMLRASEIPGIVANPFEKGIVAGITGTDIIWEKSKGTGMPKGSGEEIPIFSLVKDARPSSLYVGVSQRLVEEVRKTYARDPMIDDLADRWIVTKFPNITAEYIETNGLNGAKAIKVGGTDEAYQYVSPIYSAVLGIISSGRTAEANNITVLERFYDVSVNLITYQNTWMFDKGLATDDFVILDDIRELTYLALQRRQMI